MKHHVAVLACVWGTGFGPAQSEPEAWAPAEKVREIARRAVDERGVVGLSVGIAIDGETVFAEGFGHADLERARPAGADTVYDIASVGKQFTSASVLRLIEDGKLSLDDRIRDVVPETPLHFPNATLEQLMRHTSGFVGGELDELNPPEGLDKPRYGLEVLDDAELNMGKVGFRPEEAWVYCNSGYLLLGLAVESASGGSYADFVRDKLLQRAGLGGVFVCERAGPEVMSDSIHLADGEVSRVPPIDMTVYSGQGSICTSVVDLLGWQRALNTGQIIGAESLATMRSETTLRGDHDSVKIPYGMGLRRGELHGRFKVGHTGTYEGGSATLAHYPDDGLTVTVVTNTNGKGVPHAQAIEAAITVLVLGIEVEEAPGVAMTPEQIQRIAGHYRSKGSIKARVTSETTVEGVFKGRVIERNRHVGGLMFDRVDRAGDRTWFLMDGDRAGWWLLERHGFLLTMARRVDEASP